MSFVVFKYLVTAAIVVLASEVAKKSDSYGAIVGSLPLVTILTLVWLHVENQDALKIGRHAYLTFWYVLPSLPMFLVFPGLLKRFGFWPALLAGIALTASLYVGGAVGLNRSDIR